MNWTERDIETRSPQRDVEDRFDMPGGCVYIQYEPYISSGLSIRFPSNHRINVNDRRATRRCVLEAILPLAEGAVEAIREALRESSQKYAVKDADGFLVATFDTQELAQAEVAEQINSYRLEYPTAAAESGLPIFNIVPQVEEATRV